MHTTPTLGLCPQRSAVSTYTATVFNLTSSIPSGWTYTGGGAASTYRDSGGELRLGSSNVARFAHTSSGTQLGYIAEEARTNRCINYNAIPSGTTGLSVTGTVTVSSVSDSSAITTIKIGNVVTGNVIEASGGASGGTVVIAGTTGATGAFSASVYARVTSGTSASFGITPTPAVTTISGSSYARFKSENLTATASTDQMIITIPASTTIRFILNQLEAGKFSTSSIKVAGATATRSADVLKLTTLNAQSWWNTAQGTIVASVNPYQGSGQTNNAGIAVAGSTGTFPTDAFYIQTNSSSHKASGFGKHTSTNSASVATGIVPGRKTPVGMTWVNGSSIMTFAGPMIYATASMTVTAQDIVQLVVGSFASNTLQFNGYIDRLTIMDRALDISQIAPYVLGSGIGISERAIIGGGQSNMEGYFQAATALTNGGEITFDSLLNSTWGTSTRNWVINGSTAATSFTVWQSAGSAITRWKAIATAYKAAGGTIEAILWDQGESDLGYSVLQFKTAYLGIFQDMRTHVGSVPVIIVPLGRYRFVNNQTTDDNAAKLKQAQQELALENSWIYLAPEKIQQPLVDNVVHLTDAGYSSQASLVMRKTLSALGESVSGGVDGPEITAVTRSGTTVTVTIAHDTGGSDFTPTSSIGGFRFYDNTTEISITAAVRTNATTITLTLNSTPSSGTEKLRYSFDQNYNTASTAVVIDNSANALPLRSGEYALPYSGSRHSW